MKMDYKFTKTNTDRQKAVQLAWEREKTLVREGKGTRDWTVDQQAEMLSAKNGEGVKGFEGSHMMTVKDYPQYEGNPENIQFLTASEHFGGVHAYAPKHIHPNGRFDSRTGEVIEQTDGTIPEQPIISLTNRYDSSQNNVISSIPNVAKFQSGDLRRAEYSDSKRKHSEKSNRDRGGKSMAMRRVLSKGMNLGRHGEVGYDELHKETGEQVSEGDRLHELGAKFEKDKTKLEDAIERVQASSIKPEDKAKMIAELNAAIDALQAQYEDDVAAEEAKVQEKIEGQLEQMDQTIDELTEQADFLRDVTMDAASTDASAAAEAADAKKQEFEQMKEEYTEKLRLQMEQAEMQQRNIRNRRLSGR